MRVQMKSNVGFVANLPFSKAKKVLVHAYLQFTIHNLSIKYIVYKLIPITDGEVGHITGQLRHHLKKVHKVVIETIAKSSDPERFKCKYCGRIYNQKAYLKDHINTHTGERPHICNYCGKGFASSGNKYAHIRQNHLGKKRNYSNHKSAIKLEK